MDRRLNNIEALVGYLRRAKETDGSTLAKWLEDPADCENVMGNAPFSLSEFKKWLSAPDQCCWMLETTNGPVGYGEVWVDEANADVELAHVVVAPSRRGEGWGKWLTQLLYERASRHRYPWVYIRVLPKNEHALRCYNRAGFCSVDPKAYGLPTEWAWLRRQSSSW